jgi:hypothetical protein
LQVSIFVVPFDLSIRLLDASLVPILVPRLVATFGLSVASLVASLVAS